MKRSKKIIFACHCLLNQNARAQGVAKSSGIVKEFINYCLHNKYGIISMTCPQLLFEPVLRRPATREHYDNKRVRSICRTVASTVIHQAKKFRLAGYQVCGVFGVEGSPTCGAHRTHIMSPDKRSINVNGKGIFFDELEKILKRNKLQLPLFDWDIQAKRPLTR